MSKSAFWENEQSKDFALRYFDYFFDYSFNVTTRYSLENLENKYMDYCKSYFVRFSPQADTERREIQIGYEYVKTFLTNQATFETNSHIVKCVLEWYGNLLKSMASYSFLPMRSNTYGFHQNETNERILLELNLFQPFLNEVLDNINKYLETVVKPDDIDEFYCELIGKLKRMIYKLKTSRDKLDVAQHNYHATWSSIASKLYYHPISDLRECTNNWRLARNNSCHSVLGFFEGLADINLALSCGTFRYAEEGYADSVDTSVNEKYDEAISCIVGSPNYFCYLTPDEKREIAHQKVLRRSK